MKRILISFLVMAVFLGVDAQNSQCGECRKTKNPVAGLSVQQKAQMITDRMVRAYDLNPDQRAQLLDLNTRKLSQCDKAPCDKKQKKGCSGKKEKKGGKCKGKPCVGRQGKPVAKHGGVAYMRELRGIMSAEQFNAYNSDRAIERQMFGHKNKHHRPDAKKCAPKAGHGKPCCYCKRS